MSLDMSVRRLTAVSATTLRGSFRLGVPIGRGGGYRCPRDVAILPRVPRELAIVVPALNEEQSIGSTVERCLAAAPHIRSECGIDAVNVVVVSDGSTDRTGEIARRYEPQVRVIVFETNRGYGAAIKEGWRVAGGDLLAFLDADGTCDPRYFVP